MDTETLPSLTSAAAEECRERISTAREDVGLAAHALTPLVDSPLVGNGLQSSTKDVRDRLIELDTLLERLLIQYHNHFAGRDDDQAALDALATVEAER